MTSERDIIGWSDGKLVVPDRPVVPFIAGDGIGPEVWRAARRVIDAAVETSYGGRRQVQWLELLAGQEAVSRGLELLPEDTIETIRRHRVAIKGPTMTPVGSGHRSINVALRRELDLYASVRPVRYFEGVVSPVRNPEAFDVVVFRENTEDVYAGIEFAAGSDEARRLEGLLEDMGFSLPAMSGIGIKPISRHATRRLVRAAMQYAIAHGRRRLTLVHKGNIMKHTEGAFLEWGRELVREEYSGRPEGDAVIVDDRIADSMFQDLLLRPQHIDVLVAPNLNGDYLSDACAAQVGGLGLAPGANVGDGRALFESTHGTAPDIAGRNLANPGSMILSGSMLLEHIGWSGAAGRTVEALEAVIRSGVVTPDLQAGRDDVRVLGTDAFARAVVEAVRQQE
jgi:isocitrate dehydrogenase